MARKTDVTSVQYVFDPDTLFGESEDSYLYDKEASFQKYAQLCRQRLESAYPGTVVQVFDITELQEEQLCTAINDDPDDEEVNVIEDLCIKIGEQFKWQVPNNWFDLQLVFEQNQIPVPILHWSCQERRIPGAKHLDGSWKLPAEIFSMRENLISLWSPASRRSEGSTNLCRCDAEETRDISIADLPLGMKMLVTTSEDWAPHPLFNKNYSRVVICSKDTSVELTFEHFVDRVPGYISKQWTYDAYVQAMMAQVEQLPDVYGEVGYQPYRSERHAETLRIKFIHKSAASDTVWAFIEKSRNLLMSIVEDAEIYLQGGPIWKSSYEKKGGEITFCKEVFENLLGKMGFEKVRYIHGEDEYGRDFLLGERTKWGWPQHYGIQVKAGDVSGRAYRSDLNPILNQIELAFTMPYRDQNGEEVYIAIFIVAITGEYTYRAKEQIRDRLYRRDWRGSVHFLDGNDIRDLIRQHWRTP